MTSPTPAHQFSGVLSPTPPPTPSSSSLIAHDTPESSTLHSQQPVPVENQLYSFQTLRFSYQARGVDLTPPALIATDTLALSDHNDLHGNENIDLTGGSTLSIVQPSLATVSRSKVSHSGAEVNGTMTLAYMACQMLPDPMHLREIWMVPSSVSQSPVTATAAVGPARGSLATAAATSPVPLPAITSTTAKAASEGESLRLLMESAYAIEYFEDQDCTQFLMATAGSMVNIHEAEDYEVAPHGTVNTGGGKVAGATATMVKSKSLEEKFRHGRVVSVRWVGLVTPSDFLLKISNNMKDRAKQRHIQRNTIGPTRNEIRALEEDYDDDDDDDDDIDEDNVDDSSQEKRHDAHDNNSGYISWEPFLPVQIYPPPRINLGPIAPRPTAFVTTVLAPGFDAQGEVDPTTRFNGTQKGTGSPVLDHETSQIMMAGLVIGLLLFLGSFLMAVHYRQRRRKWYEEAGGA